MGKIKIKIKPDGTITAETKDIKGKKCLDYVQILSLLADIKIEKVKKTEEYYENNNELELDESQHLSDN